MKRIIAVQNKSNHGKTETIKRLLYLISKKYSGINVLINQKNGNEVLQVIELSHGPKIGISSSGDDEWIIEKNLTELITKNSCDVVITATRTKQGPPAKVCEFAKVGWGILWAHTTTVTANNKIIEEVRQELVNMDINPINELNAKHIMDLIDFSLKNL